MRKLKEKTTRTYVRFTTWVSGLVVSMIPASVLAKGADEYGKGIATSVGKGVGWVLLCAAVAMGGMAVVQKQYGKALGILIAGAIIVFFCFNLSNLKTIGQAIANGFGF